MNKKFVLVIVLAGIFALLVETGGFMLVRQQRTGYSVPLSDTYAPLATQTITPTRIPFPIPTLPQLSYWKTFISRKYHYTIKYPPGFSLFFDGDLPYIMKQGGERPGTGAFSFYKIIIEGLASSQDIAQIINSHQQEYRDSFGQEIVFTDNVESSLAGHTALSFYNVCQGYCQNIYIRREIGTVIYITVIFSNKQTQLQYQGEVNQILSTFTFTQ